MIKAVILKDNQNNYRSFSCTGHAGFADKGIDIICSAVSMLTINTINSIEELTECDFKGEMKDGELFWEFTDVPDEKAALLMDSLVIGLKQLQKENNQYITLEIKEVP